MIVPLISDRWSTWKASQVRRSVW